MMSELIGQITLLTHQDTLNTAQKQGILRVLSTAKELLMNMDS